PSLASRPTRRSSDLGVRRHLAHHDDLQAVLAALQAVAGQFLDDGAALVQGADEGDHDPAVLQAHFLADLAHRLALQGEAVAEFRVDVPRGAAEADHRIFFVRLIAAAADEVGVLVGLEVRQAHDHRVRGEGRGQGGDALGQPLDVEVHRAGIAGGDAVDLGLQLRRLLPVLEQGARVHADLPGDDELQAGQADALVRQLCEVEGALRVAHVHHDLERGRRHVAQVGGADLEVQLAGVDVAGVTLGAADGHFLAVLDGGHGIAGADHGRHAQLAGDDGGMAGAAAAVGDDGGGALHDRLPVGVGHVGHQHVTGLEAAHLVEAADHPRHARADLVADGAALAEHLAAGLELVALDPGGVGARLHRLRARLDDVELAADAVLGPLDVHRTAVVLLDDQRLPGQFLDLGIADAEAVAQLGRRVLVAHALAGLVGIDHADLLGAERAAQHRRLAGLQGGLVDVE